jgi:hypothetical protein
MMPDAITLEEMRQETRNSKVMSALMECILKGYIDKDNAEIRGYGKIFQELSVEEGLILRDERLLVPPGLRKRAVTIAHECHLGRVKTKQLIKETMWFPNIDKWVAEEVLGCLPCQAVTDTPQQEPTKTTELPDEPWVKLVTDFYGPLPTGEYILVIQDTYTRFPAVEILRSTKGTPVMAAFDRIMSEYGIPEEIGSDNGPPYGSRDMEKFAKYMGYEYNKNIPYIGERRGRDIHAVVEEGDPDGNGGEGELEAAAAPILEVVQGNTAQKHRVRSSNADV